MDPVRFDALARVLSGSDSRRRVLSLMTALPVVGGLLGLLSPEETEAAGRRKRRKKAHKHGKGRRRKHGKKKCTPDSVAQTCANACGAVTNNCKTPVNCGSCTCTPACDVCFTCQEQGATTPGTCVVDQDQVGEGCGGAGQVCQSDGACVCVPDCTGKCDGDDNGCAGTCTGICGTNQLCAAGTCQAYDVCASGCAFRTVQAAIDLAAFGATIRIGPGTYRPSNAEHVALINEKTLTLIGAGSGVDGTIFVGGGDPRDPRDSVVWVLAAVVELRDLTITEGGSSSAEGGGIYSVRDSTLTLTGVLVTGNTAIGGGGIFSNGSLTLNAGTVVTGNTAQLGGGIFNAGTVTRNEGSSVSGNDPDDCYSC